jgi:hypothetical protein
MIRKYCSVKLEALAAGDHQWFRSTRKKGPVTRDIKSNNNNNNMIIIIIIIIIHVMLRVSSLAGTRIEKLVRTRTKSKACTT